MATIVPWVVPPNFVQAMSSGAQAGLQLRSQYLQQQAQAAAEAQAAERLRLANEEMFQRARQDEIANQLKAEAFAQERQRFDIAQQRQARLEEANRLYGQTLGQGLQGEKPDILGAFAQAASAAPGAEAVQKLDADALLKAQNTADRGRMTQGMMTYFAQLGARQNEPMLGQFELYGTPEWQAAYQRASEKENTVVNQRLKTAIQRRADDFADSVKSIDPNISETDLKKQVGQFISSNGQSALIPQNEMKVIAGGDTLAVGIQQALDGVKAFNDKFGKDAFDQFTGSIDNRIFNLKRRFGPKFTAEDAIAARKIFQSIDQVSQAYRLSNFGTALSATEQKQFEKIIENPDSATFVPALEGAVDTTKKILSNKMSLYPYAQNPGMDELRSRYKGGESSSAAPKRVTSKAQYDSLPSGALFIDDSGQTKRKK